MFSPVVDFSAVSYSGRDAILSEIKDNVVVPVTYVLPFQNQNVHTNSLNGNVKLENIIMNDTDDEIGMSTVEYGEMVREIYEAQEIYESSKRNYPDIINSQYDSELENCLNDDYKQLPESPLLDFQNLDSIESTYSRDFSSPTELFE